VYTVKKVENKKHDPVTKYLTCLAECSSPFEAAPRAKAEDDDGIPAGREGEDDEVEQAAAEDE